MNDEQLVLLTNKELKSSRVNSMVHVIHYDITRVRIDITPFYVNYILCLFALNAHSKRFQNKAPVGIGLPF